MAGRVPRFFPPFFCRPFRAQQFDEIAGQAGCLSYSAPMKLGFMTSVCPKYTLPELLQAAKRHGYQGIEPRVEWQHGHGIELTASPKQLSAIRRSFEEAGIAVTCLATGCRFQTEDKAKNAAELEKLRQYIPVAAAVGAPVIRIFGDTVPTEA